MPTPSSIVRIRHASMQRTDTPAQQQQAANAVIPGDYLFMGLTEVGNAENPHARKAITTAVTALNRSAAGGPTQLYLEPHGGYGEGIVVNVPQGGRILGEGYVGPFVKGIGGQYPDRGARYVTLEAPGIGRVSFITWHPNSDDADPHRHATNVTINTGVGKLAQRLAAGPAIVFASADTNVDDAHDNGPHASTKPLRDAGLVSVWDELHKYPDTHDTRTIDVIYRHRADARVHLNGAHRRAKTTSDHRPVEAAFTIRHR